MAALTVTSIRLCTLALGVALALAAPALAADVTVQLDAGAGFSVKNSTGAIQRLRIDEATGNLSRNGTLFVHTTGTNNTFVGVNAGNTSTTGAGRNSAFGKGALRYNTTGYSNSAFGKSALLSNTTGSRNSAFGADALRTNITGTYNSAFGDYALHYNTTGHRNSAFGERTLLFNTGGYRNTAFGEGTLHFNTTGGRNSAFGTDALHDLNTGIRNVAVGWYAGVDLTTGSDNIYLANRDVAAESGQIKIGIVGTHVKAFMAGVFTNAVGGMDNVCVLSTGELGLCSSSGRFKEAVEDMGDASERLMALRPVSFRYRKDSGGDGHTQRYGLIAEEVAQVAPELAVTDARGQPYSVRYNELTPMLLNETQKQQRTIERQEQVIAELSSRLALLEGKVGPAAESKEAIR